MDRKRWLSLAVFVYVGVGIFSLGLPEPRLLDDRRRWETDRTRREFERLGAPFGASAQDVSDTLWPAARFAAKASGTLRAPYLWLTRYLGFFQGWRMFSIPSIVSSRLVVEIQQPSGTDGSLKWKTIYVSRSSRHVWRRFQFDQDRMRKLVSRATRAPQGAPWHRLTRWIPNQVRTDFPRAVAVRMKAERVRIPPIRDFPGAVRSYELRVEKIVELEPSP